MNVYVYLYMCMHVCIHVCVFSNVATSKVKGV